MTYRELMEHEELVQETIEAFKSLGYEPLLVPRGTLRHLRGCLWCIDFENFENIDSLGISIQRDPKNLPSKYLFRYEYALRGNIKDIPGDRRIAYTELSWKGFIKKRIESIRWVIPKETDEPSHFKLYGRPPKLGEVWDEGPHNVLVRSLNEDTVLLDSIKEFGQRFDVLPILNIYSDEWSESIRLSISTLVEEKKAPLFFSSLYIEIVQSVFGQIRVVRRQFGGLTF
jgi:hypothetical protein